MNKCKAILLSGKNKGKICNKKAYKNNNFCLGHMKN